MAVDVRLALRKLGVDLGTGRDEGARLWALCPYHQDKKPSWFIRWRGERRGQHHCFSCKEGGTLADLVMHTIGIGYHAAVEWLSQWEGRDEPAAPVPTSIRFAIAGSTGFVLPAGVVWGEPLAGWVTPPRRYAEGRGITAEQVRLWGLGYATEGRLEGRLVIPVHDPQTDEIVSYMARYYGKNRDPKIRRYLYPDGRDNPDLDVMFGERQWPEFGPARRDAAVVVTEGAINALAAERAGALHVAAMGGSDVRPLHVGKLSTFGRVVVLTDPDPAGDSALGDLVGALARHTEVTKVPLPVGEDAATLPEEELRRCLATAVPACPSRP